MNRPYIKSLSCLKKPIRLLSKFVFRSNLQKTANKEQHLDAHEYRSTLLNDEIGQKTTFRKQSIHDRLFQWGSITLISLWLGLFALVPHVLILISSVLKQRNLQQSGHSFTLTHYTSLLNPLYFRIFWHSFMLASTCTCICLALGYPFAWLLSQVKSRYKHLLLLLVIIPFWTSSLIRTYAIIAILKAKGILNTILLAAGIIDQPLQLLYTNSAVVIGLVYDLLPFMILPLYANFEKLDGRYLDAARDLGATRTIIFFRIMVPLTLPGILGGSLLVFLPAMSLFYIPDILGGAKSMLLGNLIQRQFLAAYNWPLGAALSMILIGILGCLLFVYGRVQKRGKIYQDFL